MKTLLLLMLILLFAVDVNSQTSEKRWGVGIGAGAYKVVEKDGIGFLPEFLLNRYLSPRFDLSLKGDVGLFRSDLYSELDLVMGSINLRLKLTDGTKKLRPYIYAGPGYLWDNNQGDFKVTMIGTTKNGNTQIKKSPMKMVLWTPAEREEGMRYSVNYEFNEAKVKPLYEKYLAEIVSPKIPKNGTVIIHGHTDIIGDDAYNLKLSQERANDVKVILENALIKAGRTDVKFEVHGFGENDEMAAFDNNYPEERFYNRNVIMDIIPPR